MNSQSQETLTDAELAASGVRQLVSAAGGTPEMPGEAGGTSPQKTPSQPDTAPPAAKILVPLGDEECADMLTAWLQKNPHLANCELMLFQMLKPEWYDDVPYTGIEALQMIGRHRKVLRRTRTKMRATASEIAQRFPNISVSWRVDSGPVIGDTISQVAREWDTDCIVILSKARKGFRKLLGNRLVQQIMNCVDCTVQLIQSSEHQPNPALSPAPSRTH